MTLANRLVYPSVLTVTSPLVHSDERVETMQRFRREPFWVNGELLDIPVHSGNAFRGMLRRALALKLCDLCEIKPRSLPTESFYLLFSGGYLSTSVATWSVEDAETLRRLLPHLALLGCSFRQRVHPGLLDVWRGEPVCQELRNHPAHAGHPAYADEEPPSVFDLLCEVSYTRRDDRADTLGDASSPVQMRYTFEALVPGTRLLHGFVVRATDRLVVGALAEAVACCTEWQTLGGRSAIGHGRFRWTAADTVAAVHADDAAAWRQHTVDHAQEIRELLEVRELTLL